MSIQRINEIHAVLAKLTADRVTALIGTPAERVVMKGIMDQSLAVVRGLRDLVKEGITYEKWWALNQSCGQSPALTALVGEEADKLNGYLNEIAELDHTEYYNTVVMPYIENETLDEHVKGVESQLQMLLEIWAEEDTLTV